MPPKQSGKPIVLDSKNDRDLLDQNKKDLESFFSLKNKKTQMTLSLSVLAFVLFVVASNTLPFNSLLFQNLYPKPASFAVVDKTPKNNYLSLKSETPLVVGKNSQINLMLNLEDQQPNAFVAKIQYDPKLLSVTKAESTNSAEVTLTSNQIDPKTGDISLIGNIETPSLGQTTLVTLTIKPLKSGNTTFNLTEPSLFKKPDYQNLNTRVENLPIEILPK